MADVLCTNHPTPCTIVTFTSCRLLDSDRTGPVSGKTKMSQRGTILVSCDIDQPLEVGNELQTDKLSVRARQLLRENLHERAVATGNHMAHVGQLAEDKIVKCREEPIEVGRVGRHNKEWRSLQIISARAQTPVLFSIQPGK
jgi:hypothetical protein